MYKKKHQLLEILSLKTAQDVCVFRIFKFMMFEIFLENFDSTDVIESDQ